MKPFVSIFLALLLAGGPLAWADGGKKKPSPAPGASASPKSPSFNVPIPVDHGAEGVRLPYFDNRGKLQMYFIIAKAFRSDADHLAMKNAYMQTYDDKGAPDANVFMKRSVLDLNTKIVTSDVPVIVRRADFEITGQKMVFNTQTHKGQMTGHVQMIIYNRQAAPAQGSPTPSSSASPSSSPSPSPSPQ